MNAQRLEAFLADVRKALYELGHYPEDGVDDDNLHQFVLQLIQIKKNDLERVQAIYSALNNIRISVDFYYSTMRHQADRDKPKEDPA